MELARKAASTQCDVERGEDGRISLLLRNIGTSLNPIEIVFSMHAYPFHFLGEVISFSMLIDVVIWYFTGDPYFIGIFANLLHTT